MSEFQHDETNELTYLVRDEPVKTRWLETAMDGAEQVTAEALREAMGEATVWNPGQPIPMMPGQSYTLDGQPVVLKPRWNTVDVPWASSPPPAPWHTVGSPIVPLPAPDPLTEDRIRALVCKWLRDDPEIRAIIDGERDGIVDVKHRRRVRQFDEGGYEWRGVLYRVDKDDEL